MAEWRAKLEEWLAENPRQMTPDDQALIDEFQQRFPREKLRDLTLETYCLGRDPEGGGFCWWLEYKTEELGLANGPSPKFGVWWSRNMNCWRWNEKSYESPEKTLEALQRGLAALVKATQSGVFDHLDRVGVADMGQNRRTLRVKPLYLYFPSEFLPIFNITHLRHFLRLFVPMPPVGDIFTLNRFLLQHLRGLPEFTDFDSLQVMRFLYAAFPPERAREGRNFWRVAVGQEHERQAVWSECLRDGVTSIGWNKLGDISNISREEFEQRRDEIAREDEGYRGGVDQTWTFASEIKAGDFVAAKAGMSEIWGFGEVLEPETGEAAYFFAPDGVYKHQIRVRWFDTRKRRINGAGWMNSVGKISADKWQELLDSPIIGGRFWLIAPYRNCFDWPQCQHENVFSLGWNELGAAEGDEAEFRRHGLEVARRRNWYEPVIEAVWQFGHITPGDKIAVLGREPWRFLGASEVVGPYQFAPAAPFAHQLPVRWLPTELHPLAPQASKLYIPREISAAEFEKYTQIGEIVPPSSPSQFDALLQFFGARLAFPTELIADYLLALQTKRFVILSGISGTGKTQMALQIAEFFGRESKLPLSVLEPPEDMVAIEVQAYMLKRRGLLIPRRLEERLQLAPLRDGKRSSEIVVRHPGGTVRTTIYQPSAEDRHLRLRLNTELFAWFERQFKVGDTFWLDTETGDTGDNGDDLVIFLPQTNGEKPREPAAKNYELIAVRPDWTDNRALLGYFNPLLERYETTPLLRLLLTAHAENERAGRENRVPAPFFAILDEMNLARVEHYFSDFLSALESGEPIPLHENDALESGENADNFALPRQISIPPNLFFTGTVNVDETTFMFSPKVLDRAWTLEFNEVNLAALGQNRAPETSPLFLAHLPEKLLQPAPLNSAEWPQFGALLGGELRAATEALHAILETHNRHFGYRVALEIARFVLLARDQAGNDAATLWAALDLALLQKVLPKFHGTQGELEAVLTQCHEFAEQNAPRFSRFGQKVARMQKRLQNQGFASFME